MAPQIGDSRKDGVREDRIRTVVPGGGLAIPLILTCFVVLFGMSGYELLNTFLFPELTYQGIHVGATIVGALTATAMVYFVLRTYRALLEKSNKQIAERERAEAALRESEELYRTVVENVADGITITAGTERVMVNRAFLAIHGLDQASRVIARPFDQFILPEDREAVNERVRARQRGENIDKMGEYRIVRPDGETRTIQASVEVVRYRGRPATLAVLRDVTEIKRAEMRIRDLNNELEQHVRDLEAANSDLEAFNSMVSHDLRIPVVAIQGFSRRMTDKCGEALGEKGRAWLGIIRTNADRMDQLIEDLLAYSRLGREGGRYGVISMEKLVKSIIEDLSLLYPGTHARVLPLPDGFGDERMIRQAFLNLLSNAFKFAGHGQNPAIEVRGRKEGPDNVYAVADNGVGFDMKETKRMFEIFQRLHSSDEFEGTGVGLAIVKRIASLHGGRVWAEGRPGQGATFYFVLPETSQSTA